MLQDHLASRKVVSVWLDANKRRTRRSMFHLNIVVLVVYALLLASSSMASDRTSLATRLDGGSEYDKYASHAAVGMHVVWRV